MYESGPEKATPSRLPSPSPRRHQPRRAAASPPVNHSDIQSPRKQHPLQQRSRAATRYTLLHSPWHCSLQDGGVAVTSRCRTRSPSGLASEPREEVLETEERRLLQSDASGEQLGD